MSDTNRKVAAIFQQMADISEILGKDRFRVNAFARAARVIGEIDRNLTDFDNDVKELTKLEGIGKGTAERIIEFIETGRIKEHEGLCKQIPEGLLPLLDIQGLGPKTIALIWKEGGVDSLQTLKAKLEGDELAELPGLGKKKLENLRKSIAFAEQSGGRVRLGQALPMARWVIGQLESMKQIKQIDYAGSLRRGKETIGDIDLIVAARESDGEAIAEKFTTLDTVQEVLVKGPTKCSVRVASEDGGPVMQVDLRVVEPKQYGAALLYFTGSKEHNVQLRERALKRDWTLNEYALRELKEGEKDSDADDGGKSRGKGRIIARESEQDIYKALDLPWIAPEMREARGEIKLAEEGKLPKLIEFDDIQAELHAHTTASDGVWSIEGLAKAAAERGFHTVAVTDHSKGQVQANGLDEKRLEKHIEAVRDVAEKMKDTITILAGSEVDILSDGKLDYADSLLKELDIVVASPHAALSQDSKKATKRLLKAIENPWVTIIGHATGRLINRREGLSPDMKELFEAGARRGIAFEINANNWRLDLRDTHAKSAIDAGVMLSINTDAHGPADLDQLRYGILTARRAGVTTDHVVNCMSKTQLAKWIKSTRDNA